MAESRVAMPETEERPAVAEPRKEIAGAVCGGDPAGGRGRGGAVGLLSLPRPRLDRRRGSGRARQRHRSQNQRQRSGRAGEGQSACEGGRRAGAHRPARLPGAGGPGQGSAGGAGEQVARGAGGCAVDRSHHRILPDLCLGGGGRRSRGARPRAPGLRRGVEFRTCLCRGQRARTPGQQRSRPGRSGPHEAAGGQSRDLATAV